MSPDYLGPKDLLKLARDLEKLERLKKEQALLFFRPNKPQLRMSSSDATYRCLFGGNKVGKSTWGIIESISFCLGRRPYFPSDHPRHITPFATPVKGMCFAETWDKADEVLTPHFSRWIPAGRAEEIRRQGRTVGWNFDNGSEILYSTYQMEPERMEGADKHFYHFDEPPPYSLWAPVTRGIVVHGGYIWLTLTLLSEGWIWDEIWERHEEGDPDYYATTGDIRDNILEVLPDGTVRGALREEAIQKFEKTLDDVQKEVRLHGKPQHLQGRIFKYFKDKEPWVIPEWDVPKHWPTIRAFDPHLSKPVAVLWAKVAPSGRLLVTDELFDPSIQNLDELRERILQIEKNRGHRHIALSLMDSTFNQPDVNGKSMMSVFADFGIRARPAPKAHKHVRVTDTAERFKIDPFTKQPGIVVFKNCERLRWEIKRYVHPELRVRTKTERYKEIPEGVNKKDDDLLDCLLYLNSQDLSFKKLSSGPKIWSPPKDAVFVSGYDHGRGKIVQAQEYFNSYGSGGRHVSENSPY